MKLGNEQLENKYSDIATTLSILLECVKKSNNQQNVDEFSNVDNHNKELILSLDVNNPDHIKQYANVMCLSEKGAKEVLLIHQNDIKENLIKGLSMSSLIQIIGNINKNENKK